MSAIAQLIGDRVRAARHDRGLSLAQLAEAAGVGKGSLSEIENGARNPTIGTLYALAGALEVPLATLLAEQVGTEIGATGFVALLLDVTHNESGTVEVYRLSYEPGARRDSPSHGPGVIEHLLVTAGRMLAGPEGGEVPVGPGESATWPADRAHSYVAVGETPAEAVLVIRSPAGAPLASSSPGGRSRRGR